MKKLFLLALLAGLFAPSVFAKAYYISDNLFTYMRSGPSPQFRIKGSVNAGTPIKLLSSDKGSGFSQIIDNKGRKGWIETKFIMDTTSMAVQFPELEKELAIAKSELATARETTNSEKKGLAESLKISNQHNIELEKNNSSLNTKLNQSQAEIRKLQAKVDNQKNDQLLKYFAYGGGVAGIGLLFGLLLPHIIPRRKKKNSGWA